MKYSSRKDGGDIVSVGRRSRSPVFAHKAICGKSAHCDVSSRLAYEPWCVDAFDRQQGGLLGGVFNMMAVPDDQAAAAAIGHFLACGLQGGGRVCVVALDHPCLALAKFAAYGFDFAAALESEQLAYLYYKPIFSDALSFNAEHAAVFAEIRQLAGDVGRVAFFNVDLLFNLQSESLARASAVRLAAVANGTTALGCCVLRDSKSHRNLDKICSELMPSYLAMRRVPQANRRRYALTWRKGPHAAGVENILDLETGRGYVKKGSSQAWTA